MPHSNDDLWNSSERRPVRDEPTIQLQRVAKRRPEPTRSHHVVTPAVPRPEATRRRRGAGRPYDIEADDRPAAPARGRAPEPRQRSAGGAFSDFDDLRDITRAVPAVAADDDLFDDMLTAAGGALGFGDARFDDGAYRDSRYVAGDDHFGPRDDATIVMRPVGGRRGAMPRGHDDFDDFDDFDHGASDDDHTAESIWLEPARRRSAARAGVFASVDPRLLSVGALALAAVLAVPLISTLTDDDGSARMRSVTETVVTTTLAPPSSTIVALPPDQQASAAPAGSAAAAVPADNSTSSDEASVAGQQANASSGSDTPVAADAAPVAAEAAPAASSRFPDSAGLPAPSQRVSGHCGNPYTVQQGDFWARLASATGMSTDDFVAYNNVTIDTTIHPGDIVCLPLGTAITVPTTAAPEPPATTAAQQQESGDASQETQARDNNDDDDDSDRDSTAQSTQAPSTQAPSTQAPSTTQAPSRPSSSTSRSDVEQMIRDVWPDELEEKALQIAYRESRYRTNVTSPSGCCHGVFQLHHQHLRWMSQYGVTSVDDLFDARTNIEMAYALYERSGGWGPWSATAY